MKKIPAQNAGADTNFLSNYAKMMEKIEAASQSYYGFKQKEGFNISFLKPKRLAHLTGISEKTWERMRKDGSGPPFTKINKKFIRYPIVELEKWFAAHTHTITPTE